MSETQDVWSEKKLPKNICQIGETEGQNRIYLEDYVYTYIRKSLEKRNGQVVCGVLIGTWESKPTGRCYFIKSAMVMEGLLSAKESMVSGTPLWKKTRELAAYYFPGQELIGWFLNSREEGFFDQTEFNCMHQNLYPEGESAFFLLQEEEVQMWLGTKDGLEACSGFYIYYEKNPDMQNYMLETGQAVSEEGTIDDRAILQYRTIMQERKNQIGNHQEKRWRRVCVGLAAAVVFLSVYIWQGQRSAFWRLNARNQTQDALQAAAFVTVPETMTGTAGQERQPIEDTAALETVGAAEEMIPVEGSMEAGQLEKSGESGQQAGAQLQGADSTDGVGQQAGAQLQGADSTDGMEQQAGAQLQGEGVNELKNETIPSDSTKQDRQQAAMLPGNKTEQGQTGAQQDGQQGVPAFSAIPDHGIHYYEVQSGDTLVNICLTFYGTTDMLPELCQVNGISNPALIYNGQKIYLP